MSADDCLQDMQIERRMCMGIPARFVSERAEAVTAGEFVAADAADRERRCRELERRRTELEGGAE